jgi:hypothetical protein
MTDLLDTIPCDSCGEETADPSPCDHGADMCRDCANEGYCYLCKREDAAERNAEIAADIADEWRRGR